VYAEGSFPQYNFCLDKGWHHFSSQIKIIAVSFKSYRFFYAWSKDLELWWKGLFWEFGSHGWLSSRAWALTHTIALF
jgi:hypothetical protein